MDWFEQITGFAESDYASTRARLRVDGQSLRSIADGQRYGMGVLEIPTLAELRQRAAPTSTAVPAARLSNQVGNVRDMHAQPAMAGALSKPGCLLNVRREAAEGASWCGP